MAPKDTNVRVRSAHHLNVSQARDLLDWLEAHGITAQEVVLDGDGTFSVRWSDQDRPRMPGAAVREWSCPS